MITRVPNPIPDNATPVQFNKTMYFVWELGEMFAWSALGNCGQEVTENAAREAARNWIRDGVSSLQRIGKDCGDPKTDSK